jgi:hypothetical protein
VVPGEVQQLPADVQRGQAEEVGRRGRPDLAQRPVQPDGGVLEDVAGFLPAPQPGEVPQHLAGQLRQPLTGTADQLGARRFVAGAQAVDPGLNLARRAEFLGHGQCLLSRGRRAGSLPDDTLARGERRAPARQ